MLEIDKGMVREANKNDLDEILQLYLYLHEKSIPEASEHLRNTWEVSKERICYGLSKFC
jgi:hypothetical protein